MPISAGSYTAGTGGDYATLAAALTDIASLLTGDLTITVISDQALSNNGPGSVNLNGFTLTIQGNVAMTGASGVGRILSRSSGSTDGLLMDNCGNGVVDIHSFRLNGPPSSIDRLRGVIMLRNTTAPGGPITFRIHDCIANGLVRTGRGIRCTGGVMTVEIYNYAARDFTDNAAADGGDGIFLGTAAGSDFRLENCAVHGCARGFTTNNLAATFINCYGFNNTPASNRSWNGMANATRINCAADDTSITSGGALSNCFQATLTDQFNAATGGNYLRLNDAIYTPSLAAPPAPVAPSIPGNTQSMRGEPRPGPKGYTSIGPDQREPSAAPPITPVAVEADRDSFLVLGLGLGAR